LDREIESADDVCCAFYRFKRVTNIIRCDVEKSGCRAQAAPV
jgi:hypothetical protein